MATWRFIFVTGAERAIKGILRVDKEDYAIYQNGDLVFCAPREHVLLTEMVSDSGQAEKLPEVDGGV